MKKYYGFLLTALALFVSLGTLQLQKKAKENEKVIQKRELDEFRRMEIGEKEWERRIKKSEYREQCEQLKKEIKSFPVPESDKKHIAFQNGWLEQRSYGGKRFHEGCDLMDEKNQRGAIPVLSMTKGTVEQIGWLKLGGYRIGIRSPAGNYYYYAHLDSYHPIIKKGQNVSPGQILGYMGDSGYGSEGTKGKFPVHLHVGIYVRENKKKEYSVNPYYLLNYQK